MNCGAGGSAKLARAAGAASLVFDSASTAFSSTNPAGETFASISACAIGSGTTKAPASAFTSAVGATTVSVFEIGAAAAGTGVAVFSLAVASFGFFFSQSRQSLRPSDTGKPHASHFRTCDTAIFDRPSADAGRVSSTFALVNSVAGFTAASAAAVL